MRIERRSDRSLFTKSRERRQAISLELLALVSSVNAILSFSLSSSSSSFHASVTRFFLSPSSHLHSLLYFSPLSLSHSYYVHHRQLKNGHEYDEKRKNTRSNTIRHHISA